MPGINLKLICEVAIWIADAILIATFETHSRNPYIFRYLHAWINNIDFTEIPSNINHYLLDLFVSHLCTDYVRPPKLKAKKLNYVK